ncbi:MAG: glycosyltransferase family 2 protein [Patescibacteria group bacterium]
MGQSKVTINIVTWNSLTYLPFCLSSIYKQTFTDFSVLIIDNASGDGTMDFIRSNYPQVKTLRNTQNLGFSKAHNQGIKLTKSPYILVMNPDIILSHDFLEKIIKAAESQINYQSFSGKTLKFHFQPDDLREIIFTDKIDSIGIQPHKNRSFTNLGENETDQGQYEQKREIFGSAGHLVLFKRAALQLSELKGEYYDEDFFVYKEDVDLAWRLQLNGLRSLYVPEAVAYHHRKADKPREKNLKTIRQSRKAKSRLVNFYSYRNHLFVGVKNEFASHFLHYLPLIAWYEVKKLFYLLFFETSSLKSYISFFQLLPKMYQKRKFILKNKKNMKKLIKHWFV